jgi:hypothetical protein
MGVTSFLNSGEKVDVKQLEFAEFVGELQQIQTTLNALTSICTKASFADKENENYWQLWIETAQGKKKSYLELEIFERAKYHEIKLKDGQKSLLTLRVGDEVKIARSEEAKGQAADAVKELFKFFGILQA